MTVENNGREGLRIEEIADALGVTPQTVWRWRRNGSIPISSKNRGRFYTTEEVELIRQFAEQD